MHEKKKKKKKKKKRTTGKVPCPVEQTGEVPCTVRQSVQSSVSAQVQVPSQVEADTWPPWVIPQTPPLTMQDLLPSTDIASAWCDVFAKYQQDPEYSMLDDPDCYVVSDHADSYNHSTHNTHNTCANWLFLPRNSFFNGFVLFYYVLGKY